MDVSNLATTSKHNILYERGTSVVELVATIGRTVFWQTDEKGVTTRGESRDFLVRTADLVLDGRRILPMCGDQIWDAYGGYEVVRLSDGCFFRYRDPYCKSIRIHTKDIFYDIPEEDVQRILRKVKDKVAEIEKGGD